MERFLRDQLRGGFRRVKPTRSRTMSAIKSSKNKTTENVLRMMIVRSGLKSWRMNDASIQGKPDFFFLDLQLAIFVDGCFWHCCARCGHFPKTRSDFWKAKLIGNKIRDRRTNANLRAQGVKVIRIWEHDLADECSRRKTVRRILAALASIRVDDLRIHPSSSSCASSTSQHS